MTTPLDPTQFTRESAERIARVVRAAELETPAAASLQWMPLLDPRKVKAFRVATYTGAWSIGSEKTVTFKYQTATPNTASVTNLFFPVTGTAAGDRDCAIAKEGTAWYLIDVKLATATAVFVGATTTGIRVASLATAAVVGGTETQSFLKSFSVSASLGADCSIVVNQNSVTGSALFITSTATAAVIGSTATSIFVQSTFTSTFLKLD